MITSHIITRSNFYLTWYNYIWRKTETQWSLLQCLNISSTGKHSKPKFPLRRKVNSSLWNLKIKTIVNYKIQCLRVNILIPNGRNGGRKQWDQNKTETPQGKHLNPVSLYPASGAKMWIPSNLGSHGPMASLLETLIVLFRGGLAHCLWIFRFPGFSKFLAPPLHLWLHSHSFVHFSFRDRPILPRLLLKSFWKLPWPYNSCILYACEISTWV